MDQYPRFNQPYTQLIYQPMVELVGYLKLNDFDVYSKKSDGRSAKIPIPAASNGALQDFSYGSHYRPSA